MLATSVYLGEAFPDNFCDDVMELASSLPEEDGGVAA